MNQKSNLWEKALMLYAASPLIILAVLVVSPIVLCVGSFVLCGGLAVLGQVAAPVP